MRWTEEQLQEYEQKKQSWLGVCGEDTITNSPSEADPGPESNLQSKIMAWAKERGYPCFHDWSIKKNESGWPDIFLYLPGGRHVLIELKSKRGKLRPEQKQLRLKFVYLKHEYYKVKSWKHFLAIVNST